MIKRFLFTFLLILIIVPVAMATAQDPDILVYNGKTYRLFSNPLESFYDKNESKRPEFWFEPNSTSSGNWRGYVATWEIIDEKLYLNKIEAWFCKRSIKTENGCRAVTLRDLFGKKVVGEKVLALWFSGKLRVPDGEQLRYIHMGYGSVYERDLVFEVKSGTIIKKEIIDNTKEKLPSEKEIALQELEKLKKEQSDEKSDKTKPRKPFNNGKPIIITEKGWGKVVIGAKRKAVKSILGKGENGSSYDDVYFVDYPEESIEISYKTGTDKVYIIFFQNRGNNYFVFKTDKGITWNSSPEDVIKAYGTPPRDFKDDSGNNRWRRLEYDKIDFLFQGGVLTRISVAEKLCTKCEE